MRKILGIVILSLFVSTNLYSKIIELKKCETDKLKFNSNEFIKRSYIIDTNKSILKSVRIKTDEYLKRLKKEAVEKGLDTTFLTKISTTDFDIEYADNRYIKASKDFGNLFGTFEVDLKKKTASYKLSNGNTVTVWRCK